MQNEWFFKVFKYIYITVAFMWTDIFDNSQLNQVLRNQRVDVP